MPWYVYPVGGAIITGNDFSGGEVYILARGTYDNTQFNWQSYWEDNMFDRKVVTLADPSAFDLRAYTYSSGGYDFPNTRRIGVLIQPAIAAAQPGDTIKVSVGLFTENVTVDKHVKLIGTGSGSDPAANTVLRLATAGGSTMEAVVTITGSGLADENPLLLKSLRGEPLGEVGIGLGVVGNWNAVQSVNYIRLEDVQVVGTAGQSHIENERCLDLELNKSVAHLTVLDSGFSQCDHGWYFNKHNGGTITPSTAQFITVKNTSFVDNSFKGIYVELLSDALFECGCHRQRLDCQLEWGLQCRHRHQPQGRHLPEPGPPQHDRERQRPGRGSTAWACWSRRATMGRPTGPILPL